MPLTRTLARFVAMLLFVTAFSLSAVVSVRAQVNDPDFNTVDVDSDQDQDADQDQDVTQDNTSVQDQDLTQNVDQTQTQDQDVTLTQDATLEQGNAFNAGGESAHADKSHDDNDTTVGDTNQANAGVQDQDQAVGQNGEQTATLSPVLTQNNDQVNANDQDLGQNQAATNTGSIDDSDTNSDDDEFTLDISVLISVLDGLLGVGEED